MSNIREVLQQLELFSDNMIELNSPANEQDITAFEEQHSVKLPLDYRYFLLRYNGFSLMGATVYGIDKSTPTSLEKILTIEHKEVGNPMPAYLIPFSPDGMGNHYCFDIRSLDAESCPIVFWQHDLTYTDDDPPEVVNASFADWVQEVVIDWTLEDYNYNGDSRSN